MTRPRCIFQFDICPSSGRSLNGGVNSLYVRHGIQNAHQKNTSFKVYWTLAPQHARQARRRRIKWVANRDRSLVNVASQNRSDSAYLPPVLFQIDHYDEQPFCKMSKRQVSKWQSSFSSRVPVMQQVWREKISQRKLAHAFVD